MLRNAGLNGTESAAVLGVSRQRVSQLLSDVMEHDDEPSVTVWVELLEDCALVSHPMEE